MLIDSHHHLWRYSEDQYPWINDDMSVLRHDFWADELTQVAAESGVTGFVSVQARQSLAETNSLLEFANSNPLVNGVVGWFPLADADIAALLDQYLADPLLKGVRHVVQDEPDDRFILDAEFNRGVGLLAERGLVYDILIFAKQLPASIEFLDAHPDLNAVLDHIAKPTIDPFQFDDRWEQSFREIAKRPNLTCKFSGVVTEVRDEQWSMETIRPYWDVALDAFGPSRLMFGSDWPVCLLKSGHKRWTDTVHELVSELSEHEQADFFSNNAIRVYGLQTSEPTREV
ncbi:amidohydrolase family protein [Stieleria varia]|uniref:Amidohydrolase n=1 Tax=Stieleria varia TaxID=2528005 RepID=A0A5C6AXN5_9BACT|nr:amidohydrolase family protein [Stieleria varia]TWU04490.1 Amidohydrolase [Stieleria varia]